MLVLLGQPLASVKTEKAGKSYSKSNYWIQSRRMCLAAFCKDLDSVSSVLWTDAYCLADDTALAEVTSMLEGMAWN